MSKKKNQNLSVPTKKVRCDACGCAFVPEPKTRREGEIEYSFFNCDYCGKAFIVFVTDAPLRKNIRKYREIADRRKETTLSEMELLFAVRLKEQNLKRAAELRQMYIREG
jgi:NAD-dependent SIR2 family protein deacetylase